MTSEQDDSGTHHCPDCGRQLHSVTEKNVEYSGLYKCFNKPKYWCETEDGKLAEVTEEINNG